MTYNAYLNSSAGKMGETIHYILSLLQFDVIKLESIPKELQQDFLDYSKNELPKEITLIPKYVYKEWIEKIKNHGFSQDIDLNSIIVPPTRLYN